MPTLSELFDSPSPVALVTGSGAPRVGRAIATHLASLGCHIAMHANTSVDEAEAAAVTIREQHQVEVIVTVGPLDDDEVPSRLVRQTHEHFGRLDILVNSAAIWRPSKLQNITADEMRRYFDINTIASFLCARAAAEIMAKQTRGGSIINIGDWATGRPYLDHAAYFPSKGALEVMTRSLAVEFSQMNPLVRVNCVQPGPVLLDDSVSETKRTKIATSTLVGRVGTPHHVAHAVQFLCENDFVTGVCLPVDGGRGIYAPDGMQVGLNTG
ncbi:3-oxoacyl-[acyl-carrier-protein] reductase FabG [Rubripirellula tenax]|uniref:3-oxoacyl-[acyl-carrier-protein] reductase FabG n=1 Tax=Rubripirellula tenax TaxID=2528015 RepID=A0A5C6F7Q0_9BACT|nr:SDR family oxidoreductase [Rubripirellula tenax]TWU56487.1 3-oxoacyl-[acyl-carrier-protein] reductase FabG [Rubripirellula tenax]